MKHKIEIAPNNAIYIDGERTIGSKPYGLFLTTTIIVSDDDLKRLADRCLAVIADRKAENSSEKPNNCECEPRKEQNFCGKCRYLYRDFKYGLSCYRLMDNEPCKYEECKTEPTISKMEQVAKDINVRSKIEPQTDYTPDCPFCKRYGTEECLGFDCRHYKTYKDEPQIERSE